MSVISQDGLVQLIESLKKLSKEELSLDEIKRKILCREINLTIENDKVDLFSPTLLSSFFIRYVTIEFDSKYIYETGKNFKKDYITQIYRVNNSMYELVDIENNKVKVPKNEISVNIKGAPLDVLLGFIN